MQVSGSETNLFPITEVRFLYISRQNHMRSIRIQPFSTISSPGNGLHGVGTLAAVRSHFELRNQFGIRYQTQPSSPGRARPYLIERVYGLCLPSTPKVREWDISNEDPMVSSQNIVFLTRKGRLSFSPPRPHMGPAISGGHVAILSANYNKLTISPRYPPNIMHDL
jgi:hypothetical protein